MIFLFLLKALKTGTFLFNYIFKYIEKMYSKIPIITVNINF